MSKCTPDPVSGYVVEILNPRCGSGALFTFDLKVTAMCGHYGQQQAVVRGKPSSSVLTVDNPRYFPCGLIAGVASGYCIAAGDLAYFTYTGVNVGLSQITGIVWQGTEPSATDVVGTICKSAKRSGDAGANEPMVNTGYSEKAAITAAFESEGVPQSEITLSLTSIDCDDWSEGVVEKTGIQISSIDPAVSEYTNLRITVQESMTACDGESDTDGQGLQGSATTLYQFCHPLSDNFNASSIDTRRWPNPDTGVTQTGGTLEFESSGGSARRVNASSARADFGTGDFTITVGFNRIQKGSDIGIWFTGCALNLFGDGDSYAMAIDWSAFDYSSQGGGVGPSNYRATIGWPVDKAFSTTDTSGSLSYARVGTSLAAKHGGTTLYTWTIPSDSVFYGVTLQFAMGEYNVTYNTPWIAAFDDLVAEDGDGNPIYLSFIE